MKLNAGTLLQSVSLKRKRRFYVLAMLFWGSLVVFVGLADEIMEDDSLFFDKAILHLLRDHSRQWLDSIMLFVTSLGGPVFVLLVTAVLAGLLVWQRRKRLAEMVVLVAGGTAFMNFALKLAFHRDRPALWETLAVLDSYSFPSGHAMSSSALALSVVIVYWRTKWRWWSIGVGGLYAGLIGFTRVYLGVHFPSDIIAGWCVSLIWTIIVIETFQYRKRRSLQKA